MSKDENARQIKGATVEDLNLQSDETLSFTLNLLSKYQACPAELESMLKEFSLENLVYLKLNEKLNEFKNNKNLLKSVLGEVERPLFSLALKVTNGNQSKAAHLLGCNRNTLHRKLKEFSINPREIKLKETKSSGARGRKNKKTAFVHDNVSLPFRDAIEV